VQHVTDRILRPAAAAVKLGIARSTLYRLVELRLLEPPTKIGLRASGWKESAIDDYLTRRRLAPAA